MSVTCRDLALVAEGQQGLLDIEESGHCSDRKARLQALKLSTVKREVRLLLLDEGHESAGSFLC